MLGLGLLIKCAGHVQARCCLFWVCESLIRFRKVCSMSQGRPFVWKKHFKSFFWGQLASWIRWSLRESPQWGKLCFPGWYKFRFVTCVESAANHKSLISHRSQSLPASGPQTTKICSINAARAGAGCLPQKVFFQSSQAGSC